MRWPFVIAVALAAGAGCQCLDPVVDPTCNFPCRRGEACIGGFCQTLDGGELDAGSDGGRDAGTDAGTPGDGGCGPWNCKGCCGGPVCISGTEDTGCGIGGAQCKICENGRVCGNGACFYDLDGGLLGSACQPDAGHCRQSPVPENNLCFSDGGVWPRGYCSLACTVDGFDPLCGTGICVLYLGTLTRHCRALCSVPGAQAECRPGYLCQGRDLGPGFDGGTCQPPCTLDKNVCGFGERCTDAGFCEQ
jgi:hypothetical protein